MALTQIAPPYPVFTDTDGKPLDYGYLYIGEINKASDVFPVAVYWDVNFTLPAAQPIRTRNGYPSADGITPANLYTNSDFSILVKDKHGRLVIYSPLGYGVDPTPVTGSVRIQRFTGDGVTVAFDLSVAPASEDVTQIYVEGVHQSHDTYSISGTTITFTEAPPAGIDNVEVITAQPVSLGYTDAANVSYTPPSSVNVITASSKLDERRSANAYGVGSELVDNLPGVEGEDGSFFIAMGESAYNDGGEGIFIFDASDLSTEVALDTEQTIYVAPTSDVTGASGAWVKLEKSIAHTLRQVQSLLALSLPVDLRSTISLGTTNLDFSSCPEFKGSQGCFNYNSTGRVTFGSGTVVNPKWWGPDGVSDNVEVQYAVDSLAGSGGVIDITQIYYLSSPVLIDGDNDDLIVRGYGKYKTGFSASGANDLFNLVGSTAVETLSAASSAQTLNSVYIKDCLFDGQGTAPNCITIDIAKKITIDNCYIVDPATYGIKAGDDIGTGDGSDRFNTLNIVNGTNTYVSAGTPTAHLYMHNGSFCAVKDMVCAGQAADRIMEISGMSTTVFEHPQFPLCKAGGTGGFVFTSTAAQETNGRVNTTVIMRDFHFEGTYPDDTDMILIDIDHAVITTGFEIYGDQFPDYSATNTTGAQIRLSGDEASIIRQLKIGHNKFQNTNGLGIVVGSSAYRTIIEPQYWPFNTNPIISDSGTETQYIGPIKYVDQNNNDTSGTGEDDLASFTYPGGYLGKSGGIRILATGTITGTNDAKTVKIYFGAKAMTVVSAAAGDATEWRAEAWVFNNGNTSVQRIHFEGIESDGTRLVDYFTTSAIDTTSDISIKLTGECANAGDVISQKTFLIETIK